VRNYDRRLLPGNHAKRIILDFVTKWFQQNAVFQMRSGEPGPEPLPLDAGGEPSARSGVRSMVIRDGWGSNDPADLKRKVVVQRGPYRKDRTHIGNFGGGIDVRVNGVIYRGELYTANSQYPVSIMCCSSVGAEADEIAQIIGEAFDFCRIQLREQYKGLRDVTQIEVGVEQLIDQPSTRTRLVGVPVNVTLDIQYDWLVFDVSGTTLRAFLQQAACDESFAQLEEGGVVSLPPE
jgi:hypothetical protein